MFIIAASDDELAVRRKGYYHVYLIGMLEHNDRKVCG
jgi:hypothetical protein